MLWWRDWLDSREEEEEELGEVDREASEECCQQCEWQCSGQDGPGMCGGEKSVDEDEIVRGELSDDNEEGSGVEGVSSAMEEARPTEAWYEQLGDGNMTDGSTSITARRQQR